MTLVFFFGVWEIGKASTTIQVFLTAVWEQCLFIHYSKSVTPLTLHAELISGVRSVHVHRFVCQVHICQWPSDTHSVWKVQESRCTGDEKKEAFLGLCFGLFVPQSALSLFSQICQCHLGLWVIFYPHCLTDGGFWFCENQSRVLRYILSLCAAVSVRATAGHLLCWVKTDFYRTNTKFKLERHNVCELHINSHSYPYCTHTMIALGPFILRPQSPYSFAGWGLRRLYWQKYEPVMCKRCL